MCRICNDVRSSFIDFKSNITNTRKNIKNMEDVYKSTIEVDKLRFNTSAEWEQPDIAKAVKNIIFRNENPDIALTLFIMCCWLDMQQKYTFVWTGLLEQLQRWLNNNGSMPSGRYPKLIKPHLELTLSTKHKFNVSKWFVDTIIAIAERHGEKRGNLYRLAGGACKNLYFVSDNNIINVLESGELPINFSGGNHKRFWMLIMFLVRDENIIKCLVNRAFNNVQNGNKAYDYLYNKNIFDPKECELPVDSRVKANWNTMFQDVDNSYKVNSGPPKISIIARKMARNWNMPPSAFDALLFFN